MYAIFFTIVVTVTITNEELFVYYIVWRVKDGLLCSREYVVIMPILLSRAHRGFYVMAIYNLYNMH